MDERTGKFMCNPAFYALGFGIEDYEGIANTVRDHIIPLSSSERGRLIDSAEENFDSKMRAAANEVFLDLMSDRYAHVLSGVSWKGDSENVAQIFQAGIVHYITRNYHEGNPEGFSRNN